MHLPRLLRLSSLLVLAVPLFAGAAPEPVPPGDPIEGKWFGMAGFPQDRVELGFEIKRDAQGVLRAFLSLPANNFYDLQIPGEVERDGERYLLRSYVTSFSFADSRDRVTGTFFPLNAPLAMERVTQLPREAPLPDLPAGPGPTWRAKLGGAIYAPAAVRDGVAFVGTTSGVFNAVRIADGSLAWAVAVGRPILGEALVTDEAVYFSCDNGYLFKLARADGKEIWRYDLGGERTPRVLMHPTVNDPKHWDHRAPKPALADGVIYVGSADGSFHAVRADSGGRLWRHETPGRIRGDALIDDTRVVFGNFDGLLVALDRTTGAEVWKRETRAAINASPARVGDRLIVANRGGLLVALDPPTGQTQWRALLWGSAAESTAVSGGDFFYIGASDLRRITCYDPADGRVVWRTDIFGIAWGRPAVTEKFVFASAGGFTPYQMRHLGGLNALDRATGKILWRWTVPPSPDLYETGFAAGPTVADDLVIVGSMNGVLYAFPVAP